MDRMNVEIIFVAISNTTKWEVFFFWLWIFWVFLYKYGEKLFQRNTFMVAVDSGWQCDDVKNDIWETNLLPNTFSLANTHIRTPKHSFVLHIIHHKWCLCVERVCVRCVISFGHESCVPLKYFVFHNQLSNSLSRDSHEIYLTFYFWFSIFHLNKRYHEKSRVHTHMCGNCCTIALMLVEILNKRKKNRAFFPKTTNVLFYRKKQF